MSSFKRPLRADPKILMLFLLGTGDERFEVDLDPH
jgi:hypothetical protein